MCIFENKNYINLLDLVIFKKIESVMVNLKKLFISSFTLGFLGPFSLSATEINSKDILKYTNKDIEFSGFSKIYPSDWVYKAISRYVKSKGCVSIIPKSSITRLEAASIIDSCFKNHQELTYFENKLVNEFKPEIITLNSNRDKKILNYSNFKAGTFSSTTIMSGSAAFQVGGVKRSAVTDKLTATYSYDFDLNTSFNGNDNLFVGIEAGNSGAVDFTTDNSNYGGDNLTVDSIYYKFKRGLLEIAVGPRMDPDDHMPTKTTLYSDSFFLGSEPFLETNYYVKQGNGLGIAIASIFDNGINISASVIGTGGDSSSGFLTSEGIDIMTFSIGYDRDNLGGGLIFAKSDSTCSLLGEFATSVCNDFGISALLDDGYTVMSVGGYWTPDEGKTTLSATSNFIDISAKNIKVDEISNLHLGIDRELGNGTLSAAWKTFPFYKLPDVNEAVVKKDDLGSFAEIYYTYNFNDSLEIKPGIAFAIQNGKALSRNPNDDISFELIDRTIIGLETVFKF